MATAGQVFYVPHCLEAVLPHVLFSAVTSSLLHRFPPSLNLAKRDLAVVSFFDDWKDLS